MLPICPVMSNSNDEKRCLGKLCAWWDEKAERCAVVSILKATNQITEDGLTSLDDVERAIKELD